MGFLTGFLDNASLLILVAAILWLSCNVYTKENPNAICQMYGYKISEGALAEGKRYIETLENENAQLKNIKEENAQLKKEKIENQEELRKSKDELSKLKEQRESQNDVSERAYTESTERVIHNEVVGEKS